MMMEAMRLSLLEHEEQQRRQAQAQSRQESESNAVPNSAPPTHASQDIEVPASIAATAAPQTQSAPVTTAQSTMQLQQTQPRTSSLASEASTPVAAQPRHSATPLELGLSSSMMAELSELVEGGLPNISPPHSTAPAPIPNSPIASSSTTASASPTVGSPGRVGMNPNNPFRRMGGSSANSPSHSRHPSALQSGWTNSDPGNPDRTIEP